MAAKKEEYGKTFALSLVSLGGLILLGFQVLILKVLEIFRVIEVKIF